MKTTSLPLKSFALCTWAREADPIGKGSICLTSKNFSFNSDEIIPSTVSKENCGTESCRVVNSSIHVLGIKSGLADNNWPIFIKADPSLINSSVNHLARILCIFSFLILFLIINIQWLKKFYILNLML